MKYSALLSRDRVYRYDLWRIWDDYKKPAVFIGLNPSTADERKDDPTIRRCMAFATAWGYGSLCMLNLFAFRATHPSVLKRAADPIGPVNNGHILDVMAGAGLIICAWGVHGSYLGRDRELLKLTPTPDLHCLGVTQYGFPRHPLYVKAITRPTPFKL